MATQPQISEVLVLEPFRLCAAVMSQTVSKLFPLARIYTEGEPGVAAVTLAEHSIDLFIVALRGFDLDVITLLGVWSEHHASRTRVLVVTPEVNSTAVVAVRKLPIAGIFDLGSQGLSEFEFACRAVAAGWTYWSRTVLGQVSPPSDPSSEMRPGNPPEYVDDARFLLARRTKAPISYRSRFRPPPLAQ